MPLPIFRAATLALAALAGPAAAHDFWLQPDRFQVAASETLSLALLVGHGEARQRSPLPLDRITEFVSLGAGGVTDQRDALDLGQPASDAVFDLDEPGRIILALQTDGKRSELPAQRFDDYVAFEGLTLVAADRAGQRPDTPGSEIYSRSAKALVTVGEPEAIAVAVVTRPVGLALEIVPTVDPSALPTGTPFAVTVLLRGEALAGALVMLTDLDHDAEPVDARRTDAEGAATFAIPRAGEWLLNVVWSEPLPEGRDADYLTVFSSLSFAVGDDVAP